MQLKMMIGEYPIVETDHSNLPRLPNANYLHHMPQDMNMLLYSRRWASVGQPIVVSWWGCRAIGLNMTKSQETKMRERKSRNNYT